MTAATAPKLYDYAAGVHDRFDAIHRQLADIENEQGRLAAEIRRLDSDWDRLMAESDRLTDIPALRSRLAAESTDWADLFLEEDEGRQ